MASEQRRDIVVIGGSAGGIAALRQLLGALPPDFAAAIFVVLHLSADSPNVLPDLLDRAGPLPAVRARNGLRIRPGQVVVAPPDQHLLLEVDGVRVSHGPRENRHRPSIDVLFRSAAVAFGPRVTGVVLSGMLDDGAAGLWAVKRRGGAALVQDPAEAEYPDMPRNAMELTPVDGVHGVPALAARLVDLAGETVPTAVPPLVAMKKEIRMAADDYSSMEEMDTLGRRVPLTCPECGGAMWEIDEATAPRFRCHVGHAYSMRSLASEQSTRVEGALWAALRALEESRRLAERLAGGARARGDHDRAEYHDDRSAESARHAEVLRTLLDQTTYSATLSGEEASS